MSTTLEFVAPSKASATINALLYGPPGSGKSTGALSAPGPILIVNSEGQGGIRFARRRFGDQKIRELTFAGKQTFIDAYLYLKERKGGEKTLVIDTIGEAHRMLLDEMAKDGRPTMQQWGDVQVIIERFIRSVRDLDINVILVCHEEIQKDEATGEAMRMPLTGGRKLPALLTAQVDVVAYTGVVLPTDEAGDVKYMAQLVSANGRYGKDRSGLLGTHREVDLSEWIQTATTEPAATSTERKAA